MNSLSLLCIKSETLRDINFDGLIADFAIQIDECYNVSTEQGNLCLQQLSYMQSFTADLFTQTGQAHENNKDENSGAVSDTKIL